MLSTVATLSARYPAQRAIAVAISSVGTWRTSSAVQHCDSYLGDKQTSLRDRLGHIREAYDDPALGTGLKHGMEHKTLIDFIPLGPRPS